MVKNLKLNIKNAQIAQALKIKPKGKKKVDESETAASKATTKGKTSSKKKDVGSPIESTKPKARILSTPKKVEEPKVVEQPPAAEPKEKITKTTAVQTEQNTVEEPSTEKPEEVAKIEPKPKKTEAPEKEKIEEKKKEEATTPAKKKSEKSVGFKDFKEFRQQKRKDPGRFDSRDRQGLRDSDDGRWRKKRPAKYKRRAFSDEEIIRPKKLSIRIPITIKDLASEMKLKSSQLVSKLFMQGVALTLNDYLDDETTLQLLGQEFGCEISIDTSEEERLRITDQTIEEEISAADPNNLVIRPPVLTFMGHVDHGKTSLIDSIRKINTTELEAGAITQHIGAFKTKTKSGDVTILDTPGHEAFSEMRLRGANVTDIVVLVVAGDEGIRDQTTEAINQAKEAKVPIVVAVNKCDRPNFDIEKVNRQLADQDLLPEAWGGTTITVKCSAVTKEGIDELLEMCALQAEVQELRANPNARARGTILESEMHKGMGAVATVLVQNGTLRMGDAIVFGDQFGRIKTMHDEHNNPMLSAGPSTPVKITGLSGLAEAGCEFILVGDEKEARTLAEDRAEGHKWNQLQQSKKAALESLLQMKKDSAKIKILPIILRADVQGSLEALASSLMKIESEKVQLNIVNSGVGEISESDIELAAASKATIIGFHTRIELHAESLIKQLKVSVHTYDVIYHAIEDVKKFMQQQLDKVAQENETGEAEVKAIFKSSHLGVIAGCIVNDGVIKRNCHARLLRKQEIIWKGKVSSLKRVKEDVREVQKGLECGIILENYKEIEVGDIIQAYEITYHEQEL